MGKKITFKNSTFLVVLILFAFYSNGQTTCLVADYKLDGNADDNSLNGNNGTLYGTTPTTDRFGRNNKALHFNGASDYVQLGTDADFAQRTISLWFKVDSFPASGGYSLVFSTDFATIKYGWTAISVSNTGVDNINSTVGANGKVYANAAKNSWYHYVILVNSSWVKYYLNNTIIDSFANNSFTHSGDGDTKARLGTSRKGVGFFKGSIDDVKIYDCALSRKQIDSLYNFKPNSSCIVADYKLDGNAADSSGNGYTGTLYGTTPTANRFGKANSALKFNGVSDYVRLGTDADFAQRTISLWFKVDSFPTSGAYSLVFSTDFAAIKYGWTAISVSNTSVNNINSTVGSNGKVYANAVKNKWYNYVILVDGSWVKYFLNGQVIDSFANNSFSHSVDGDTKARLGTSRKNVGYFKGSIDDVKIYDCALSRADIVKLYTPAGIKSDPEIISRVKIYPNPAKNKITIENSELTAKEFISIYNMQGQLLLNQEIQNSKTEIDINQFSKGIYVLIITSGNSKMISKIVKE